MRVKVRPRLLAGLLLGRVTGVMFVHPLRTRRRAKTYFRLSLNRSNNHRHAWEPQGWQMRN